MALPISINAGDPDHIGDHEEIHTFLASVASPFEVASADSQTYANRPAAGQTGRIYHATDTGEVFFDTGSQWLTLKAAPGTQDLVTTQESTSSLAFTNLATTGPSVTVFVGDSGQLLVGIHARMTCTTLNGAAAQPEMSFELGGANATGPSAANSIRSEINVVNAVFAKSGVFLLEGLVRGSTTVTAQYRGGDVSDVLSFSQRRLWALPVA